jgi:ATP-dependent Lhr-like helicase
MTDVGSDQRSAAFDLYHPDVRRWVWQQHWTELRDAQELAARPIISGSKDVLIAAATASGKTEAAFLPIVSNLIAAAGRGVTTLYVAPLRALINDQFERLSGLCDALEVPVHRWHGDVDASAKQKVIRSPSGILLITPESLEALFVRRGAAIAGTFAPLRYVVIDEVHAFIGTERGRQVQSLLDRLEVILDRTIPRIGLSATIGDLSLAAGWLRPRAANEVVVIEGDDGGQEIKLQLRGYELRPPAPEKREENLSAEADPSIEKITDGSTIDIATQVFQTARLGHHLIFANSRADVELYTDLLRRRCESESLPVSFFPHHGSLSREIREEAESRLKDPSRPASAVCTVTLELGIDVGSVESVAQIGAPSSVAGLRQRLGRSGRRGQPAVLRLYVQEPALTPLVPLHASLRAQLVQSIAVIRLLAAGWYEPPLVGDLHLSTLVQQLLSMIAQYGGASPRAAWRVLCERGPFAQVDQAMFSQFLLSLGDAGLITQMSDGTLLLAEKGERIVNHYQFYAAFASAEEFRIVAGNRTLGSLPISDPLAEGSYLIFAGRRWIVVSLDLERRVIEVKPAPGGRVPHFGGGGGLIHDRIREEMRHIYTESDVPSYLDGQARELLDEGRGVFRSAGLGESSVIESGSSTLLFPWLGDRAMNTLALALRTRDQETTRAGVAIGIMNASPGDVLDQLEGLADEGPFNAVALATTVPYKQVAKWDWALSEGLLNEAYGHRDLDVTGAWNAACFLIGGRCQT